MIGQNANDHKGGSVIYDKPLYRTYAVSGSIIRSGILLAGLIVFLSGCAATGGLTVGDSDAFTEVEIDDAVPRAEPKSKFGNPASYVVFGKRYHVKSSSSGHVEKGMASWYGPGFHGRRTSSGERYDMYAMTAAHKSLPLPTYVEVTNVQNGRSAIVKVNDRGPFKDGRVIDLSYAAAKKLGVVKPGVAVVELRAIDPARPKQAEEPVLIAAADKPASATDPSLPTKVSAPVAAPRSAPVQGAALDSATASAPAADGSSYDLQVGAFGQRVNAEQLRNRLVEQLAEQVLVRTADGGKAPLYKVRVGPMRTSREAKDVSQQLASLGLTDSRVIAE